MVIGYTPSASAVAVKVILVGAGETRSPTKLKALATDSLAKKVKVKVVLAKLAWAKKGMRKTARMKASGTDPHHIWFLSHVFIKGR